MKRFLFLATIVLLVALACSAYASGITYYPARANTGTNTAYASYYTMSVLGSSGATLEAPGLPAAPNAYLQYYVSSNTPVVGIRHATWQIPLAERGYYDVDVTFGSYTSAKSNVKYVVTDKNGDTEYFVDQTSAGALVDTWIPLGTHEFDANSPATTKIKLTNDNQSTSGNLYAGALRFTDVTPPAPTNLTAAGNLDGTAIDVAWTAPDPAPVSYTVERSDNGGASWSVIATDVTATTLEVTDGDCDIAYSFRAFGVSADAKTSRYSNVATTTKCVSGPPAKATNPTHADGTIALTTAAGTLSWESGAGTLSHDVYFGTNPTPGTSEFQGNQDGLDENWAYPALQPNTDYYWRIDEKNLGGTTTGDVWHFKTGVSLTIKAIRANNRGEITHFLTDVIPEGDPPGRAWDTTTWHSPGEAYSVEAVASSPYSAVGWSYNADGSSPFDGATDPSTGVLQILNEPMPTSNVTLYAVFSAERLTLVPVCDPVAGGTITATNQTWPGISTPTPLDQFEVGEVAHLVATPAAGYVFAGWESDVNGTFVNRFAATTNYTMTADLTQTVTAYFAKASVALTSNGVRTIASGDLAGTYDDWWTGTNNIGNYTLANSTKTPPRPDEVYSRIVTKFPDTIPAMSVRHGLARLTAFHNTASSYSSSYNLTVRAYPILTPWVYSTTAAGATWRTVDGTNLWTTPGCDYNVEDEMGTAVTFTGVPAAPGASKQWILDKTVDWRTKLPNGILFKGDQEGLLVPAYPMAYRKGFGSGAATSTTPAPCLYFYYNPPTGANSGVIKDWAFLGAFAQGVADDHQARIDTDQVAGTVNGVPVTEMYLAPKIGATYNGKTWAVGTSADDIIDLTSAGWLNGYNESSATYAAVYIKNPGDSKSYYIGLGSDDYSKTWLDTSVRAYKYTASGVAMDQAFQGPFTMGTGWHRLLIKIENGSTAHGFYCRLANADRTALTDVDTLTFATSDNTAPSNPTATAADGVLDGVSQSAIDAPLFTFADSTDPEVSGEGVSGVKGFKVYFGSDPAGVPETFQTGWTFQAAAQVPGTYYLRVKAVDQALNESEAATVFTFVYAEPPSNPVVGLNSRAVRDAIIGTASANYRFTVWGKVAVVDADSFTLDDGSGLLVTVNKAAHGLVSDEYASATGTLNVSNPEEPVMTATSVKKHVP